MYTQLWTYELYIHVAVLMYNIIDIYPSQKVALCWCPYQQVTLKRQINLTFNISIS